MDYNKFSSDIEEFKNKITQLNNLNTPNFVEIDNKIIDNFQ